METTSAVTENTPHRVFLITHSNIDKSKFPTRESFGRACVSAFGGNKVLYFACSRENHQESNREHYHVALRLNPPQIINSINTISTIINTIINTITRQKKLYKSSIMEKDMRL